MADKDRLSLPDPYEDAAMEATQNLIGKSLGKWTDPGFAILNALDDHVAILDARGTILAVNEAWERFARQNGAPDTSQVSVEANYLEVCLRAMKAGDPIAKQALIGIESVLSGGTDEFALDYECSSEVQRRWFTMTVRRQTQPFAGVVIIHRNITDRKLAELALRSGEERLKLALDVGQMGTWDRDARMNTVTWSREMFKIMGLVPFSVQPTYKTWTDRVHPDDLPSVNAAMNEAIAEKKEYRFEYRVIWPDGSIHRVLARGKPIYDQDGQCNSVMGLVVDITANKQADVDLCAPVEETRRLRREVEAENVHLREAVSGPQRFGNVECRSGAMLRVLLQAEQVAPTDTTVLILGETGTGKELLARSIHGLSSRRERPLVKVNCATLPATLIESELFGHERGAFTGAAARRVGRFEIADGASIFLDEIGELPLELQTKLLRVLQEGEFDRLGSSKTITVNVRVIAATNRDLSRAVREGKFRSDLYYRLNVYPIQVPPLRERREDIGPLALAFLEECKLRLGRSFSGLSQHVLSALQGYDWPGNVRELQNVIERAAVTSSGGLLRLPKGWDALNVWVSRDDEPSESKTELRTARPNASSLKQIERDHILEVLERTHWRIEGSRGAAAILGLNSSTLRSRMNKLGIKRSLFLQVG
jgi:PAS domain S-box-containing protein